MPDPERSDSPKVPEEILAAYPPEVRAALSPGLPFDTSVLVSALSLRASLASAVDAVQTSGPADSPYVKRVIDRAIEIREELRNARLDAPPVLAVALRLVEERLAADVAKISEPSRSKPLPADAPEPPLFKPSSDEDKPHARPAEHHPRTAASKRTLALGAITAAIVLAGVGFHLSRALPPPSTVPFAPPGTVGSIEPSTGAGIVMLPRGASVSEVAAFRAGLESQGKSVVEIAPLQFLVAPAKAPSTGPEATPEPAKAAPPTDEPPPPTPPAQEAAPEQPAAAPSIPETP